MSGGIVSILDRRPRLASLFQTKPQPDVYTPGVARDSHDVKPSRAKTLPTTVPLVKDYQIAPSHRADWSDLPHPVLEYICDQLRHLHLVPGSESCTTCCMRDLVAMQLACKEWLSAAQKALYTRIEIVGNDDPQMLIKWRLGHGARLIRLRSTLRRKPLLAGMVESLHVPDPHIPLYTGDDCPNPDYDAYLCTVASLVMECPNLQALTGFIPFYNHTFDRLTHALSTRPRLKQHCWVMAENDDISQRLRTQLPPGVMGHHQVYQFMQYHRRWTNMDTLVFCSPGGLGVLEHDVFVEVLHCLPSLRRLCITSFDADDFHDRTLLMLPPIQSLRLEECVGVTEAGLCKWAASPRAHRIARLDLIHQDISNLATLSRLFARLDRLERFTIVQSRAVPEIPSDAGYVVLHPILSSRSLKTLHWDIDCLIPGPLSSCSEDGRPVMTPSEKPSSQIGTETPDRQYLPNDHLALSIMHGGFPSLNTIRAPHDNSPPGLLESLCLQKFPFSLRKIQDDINDGSSNSVSSCSGAQEPWMRLLEKHMKAQTGFSHGSASNSSDDRVISLSTESSTSTIFQNLPSILNDFHRPKFLSQTYLGREDHLNNIAEWGQLLGVGEKANIILEPETNTREHSIANLRKDDAKETGSRDCMSEDMDDRRFDDDEALSMGMCIGLRNESKIQDGSSVAGATGPGYERTIKKVLTSISTSRAVADSTKNPGGSSKQHRALKLREKSGSKTSQPRSNRHVPRPRGVRGGAITVEDFFR